MMLYTDDAIYFKINSLKNRLVLSWCLVKNLVRFCLPLPCFNTFVLSLKYNVTTGTFNFVSE